MKRKAERKFVPVVAALCLLGVAVAVMWWDEASQLRDFTSRARLPAISGAFTLMGTDGATVTESTYRDKIQLVYFGYTYCPDACPATLKTIASALDELGPPANRIQPLFITIDPQRDTHEVLAQYVKSFGSRVVGLTGTPEQIAAAAKAYGVYYAQYKTANAPDGYLMDHTPVVFVMNEDGRLVPTFAADTSAAQMASRPRTLIAKTS